MIRKLYGQYVWLLDNLQSVFLLAVRLYWGLQFREDGWGKLTNADKVTEYFTSINVPAPHFSAYMVGGLELVGGILLILGLGSRLIALPLTVNMTMAFVFGDRDALKSWWSDPDKFYAAAPYTYLFASILILLFGPGKFSLDYLLKIPGSGREKR